MTEKSSRKNLIAEIIRTQKVHNQEELASLLAARGVSATQATLSRDVNELGAVKLSDPEGGQYYSIPSSDTESGSHSHFRINDFSISGQLCVIHCQPGFASAIGTMIDSASLSGIMGTVAGDDTVLLMLRTDAEKYSLTAALKSMFDIPEGVIHLA